MTYIKINETPLSCNYQRQNAGLVQYDITTQEVEQMFLDFCEADNN